MGGINYVYVKYKTQTRVNVCVFSLPSGCSYATCVFAKKKKKKLFGKLCPQTSKVSPSLSVFLPPSSFLT